jgi:hypothetical protein
MVCLPSLLNIFRNLLLAFLLMPNARRSPFASACIVSQSNRVFSFAISGKYFENMSNGIHPHCRALELADV